MEGVLFGPQTGTFMSQRNQSYFSIYDKKRPLFYGWHCFSIKLIYHTIDFMVPCDVDIFKVLNTIQMIQWKKYKEKKAKFEARKKSSKKGLF